MATVQKSKQLDSDAEKSNNLKSISIANMSYEIRTQLNGIIGMAQVLLQPEDTGSFKRDDVKIILESRKKLLVLFDDLMNMSKIETGEVKITGTTHKIPVEIYAR
jgi:signal transduction histidine kinase